MRRIFVASLFVGLLLVLPARTDAAAPIEAKVPSAQLQEILIKTALLTLNDANLTGNYSVLHARLSKPFREQFTPEQLKEAFKAFAEHKTDWSVIAIKPPVPTAEPVVDKRGALVLRGYFDTSPSRVNYELDFIPSEDEWKPIKLNVRVKPPDEK